jgi:hypothetical protein
MIFPQLWIRKIELLTHKISTSRYKKTQRAIFKKLAPTFGQDRCTFSLYPQGDEYNIQDLIEESSIAARTHFNSGGTGVWFSLISHRGLIRFEIYRDFGHAGLVSFAQGVLITQGGLLKPIQLAMVEYKPSIVASPMCTLKIVRKQTWQSYA